MSAGLVSELEAVALRAWPAGEEARHGGWLLRANGGYTRRANSVQPLGDPGKRLDLAIERASAWYRERGLRPIFRMNDGCVPQELDHALASGGWPVELPTLVMTRDDLPASEAGRFPDGFVLALDEEVLPDWLAAYASWHGHPSRTIPWHRTIVERIRAPRVVVRLLGADGNVAAVGLAVADPPWLGLFDLVTAPRLRGRGLGRALVLRLLAWGAQNGAGRAYLQVEERNGGARRLYGHLGFRTAYAYWYRVAEPPQ